MQLDFLKADDFSAEEHPRWDRQPVNFQGAGHFGEPRIHNAVTFLAADLDQGAGEGVHLKIVKC